MVGENPAFYHQFTIKIMPIHKEHRFDTWVCERFIPIINLLQEFIPKYLVICP